MQIHPYEGFDSIRFNKSSKSDVIAIYGQPTTIRKNRNGASEFHYKDFVLRFDSASETFRECTLLPYAKAIISGVEVTWADTFLLELCKLDAAPWNAYGFIIFAKLGIAVTGIHDNDESQMAITLFDRCDLDEFLRGSTTFAAIEPKRK